MPSCGASPSRWSGPSSSVGRSWTDEYGYLPLHAAAESGSPLEVLECIYWPGTSAISTRVGQHQVLPVHCVGHQSPPECVAFLLDKHPRSIKLKTTAGELPVHCAISNGAPRELVQILVGRYPGSVDEANSQGFRPIHVAAVTTGPQQLNVMRYLLEVSPQSVRARTSVPWGGQRCHGDLPLHLAVRVGPAPPHIDPGAGIVDPAVVQLLLEHWCESARERARSYLPVHFAVCSLSPSVEAIRRLLAAYPEALHERDPDGSTLLHAAARNPATPPNLFRLLLLGWPGSILEADAAGDLPVHVALRGPEIPWGTVELLGGACPPSLRMANVTGERPVHIATARDCPAAVRIIAAHSPEALRDVGPHGNTPAHLAAACDYVAADLVITVADAWPESLLATNENGDTPILVAIDRAHPSVDAASIFVDRRPESLRVPNVQGTLPLFVAIAWGHLPIVRLIAEKVPEMARQVDARKTPPLFQAAGHERMDLDVVFLLLRAWPEVVLGRAAPLLRKVTT
jgi:ankyrin repeat protein